ncbi:hypothetical protein EG328_002051 [Venturia inaequalis]|uniref:BTB domain transcription factor n=1 Tax=Venturia inaequalis TaxID=5025 RepID=A0A8H3UW68_VENIN|nr:hypothetical protein EG328_002051 [Venturia inaequalis]RDI76332.1 hypothetical protein Vi05172_g13665 [Venturia inaequalis]
MPPRRSSRKSSGSNASSSPPKAAGTKRKADSAASPKKAGKPEKAQKTLEQTMPDLETNGAPAAKEDAPKDLEMNDAATANDVDQKQTDEDGKALAENAGDATAKLDGKESPVVDDQSKPVEQNGKHKDDKESSTVEAGTESAEQNGHSNKDSEVDHVNGTAETQKDSSNGGIAVESAEREKQVASNIIEKGIIYFFTRSRVGIEEPENVQDLQRTFFVMRPLPTGAKLGDAAVPDTEQNRLVALPKKVFPKGENDRFMAFIEKSKVSMKTLKEEFFQGSEYETQTLGTRHNSPVTPIGEGVYALTEVGNSTHLAYVLTIPEKPEQVQDDLGLREKGSFVISLKNPTRKGPANATLDEKPDYPQKFIDDFRGLAWMPIHKAEYLDYPNAQILLIGEGQDKFGKALEATDKDKKDDNKESAEEELEKLEDEDQIRINHLHGEDSVFDDLHISKKDYPSSKTTW